MTGNQPMMLASVLATLLAAAGLASAHDQVHFDNDAYNNAEFGAIPNNEYRSANAISPQLQVNKWDKEAMSKSGSHIVLRHDGRTPGASHDASPLILRTDDLTTVFVNRSFEAVANVNVQQFEGKPILTFYGGPMELEGGIGNGVAYGFDDTYHEVGRVTAEGLSVGADTHEFVVTDQSTAIVTAYETVHRDLRNLTDERGARRSLVRDSIFQEIELNTFKVLFEWRASEHIDLADSFQPIENVLHKPGWDFFHINSVQKSKDGNYLVSARHTHSIYMIDGRSGQVLWTLGGKRNDFFEFGYPVGRDFTNPVLSMAWQHHAQFYPGRDERELTFFDNHRIDINGWGCTENCSRGLHISLDAERKTVQLLNEFLHPAGLWSITQGSLQVLEGGNVFVGWGRNPAFTEHLPNGECVFDVQFSPWRSPATEWDGLDNYRAFKVDWVGRPFWKPDIVAHRNFAGVSAWLSWNGATEVAEWVLLASKKEDDLDGADKVAARAKRDGFETKLWFPGTRGRYLRAVALDARGAILKSSGIFDLRTKRVKEAEYPVTEVAAHEEESSDEATEGGQGGGKLGIPALSYHDMITYAWSWGGMFLKVAGFGLGVWAFTRFF